MPKYGNNEMFTPVTLWANFIFYFPISFTSLHVRVGETNGEKKQKVFDKFMAYGKSIDLFLQIANPSESDMQAKKKKRLNVWSFDFELNLKDKHKSVGTKSENLAMQMFARRMKEISESNFLIFARIADLDGEQGLNVGDFGVCIAWTFHAFRQNQVRAHYKVIWFDLMFQ